MYVVKIFPIEESRTLTGDYVYVVKIFPIEDSQRYFPFEESLPTLTGDLCMW